MLGEVLQTACNGEGGVVVVVVVVVVVRGAGEVTVPTCQRGVLSKWGRRNASAKAGAGRAESKSVSESSSMFILLGSCRASLL